MTSSCVFEVAAYVAVLAVLVRGFLIRAFAVALVS